MNKIVVLLTACLFFVAVSCGGVSAAEVKVGAGQAPMVNILKPIEEPFEKATGLNLIIISGSPKNALIILEIGHVEAAFGGLGFDDWMKYMEQEGEAVKDPSVLRHAVIGEDTIKVMTHKDNPVCSLTREQLKGIFTGKIRKWNEVGGNEIPITVVWTRNLGGNNIFTKKILDMPLLRRDVTEAEDSFFARELVKSNPGAIAIGPLGIVDDTIKSPEIPEIRRPITIITKGEPSPNVQKLIDFIKGEGQKYIKQ